jgi:SWI/SNF-related matrix-associated actin-dependent regulator 1 of chromatin subfamily A
MRTLKLQGNKLALNTPYDKDEVDALKHSFPQARWDRLNKTWLLPVTDLPKAIEFSEAWGITIDEELERLQLPKHPIGRTSIRLKNGKLKIRLPYEPVQVTALKTIPGIQWDHNKNEWSAPYKTVHDIIQWATNFDIEIPESILEQAEIELRQAQHSQDLANAETANITVPNLQLELYPYQKAGVAYATEKQRCFIADEMGLGKSLQALAVTEYTNQYPALIICPSSLTEDWNTKIKEALPNRTTQTIQGRKTPNMTETDYTIIGYPNIHAQKPHLNQQNYNTLILDESHYCKNRTAQRTKAAKNLAKNIPPEGNVLLLTGTPITNRPAEYAPQLEIIQKIDEFGGLWNFYKRYCDAYKDQWGHWQIYGSSNLKELHNKLKTHCYIRREKQDVLPDLPPITYNTITTQMAPKYRKEYNHALQDLQDWYTQQQEQLAEQNGGNPTAAGIRAHYAAQNYETLIQLTALRQITAKAKLTHAIEWVQNANDQGHKIVIAAHHRDIVQTLSAELNSPMIIGGQTPQKTETAKHEFMNNTNCMNIIISITAAAHGHTLTASNNMLILEAPWTPAQYHQTTARIHRIGQNNNVTIHNLIIPNTIDQHIYNTLDKKTQNTQPAITNKTIQKILESTI